DLDPVLDPVVQEVVTMLNGGVAEPVVTSWLETSGRRPARVDGSELVALQKAKASDDLMKRLIRLARGIESAPAPAAEPSRRQLAPPAPSPQPAPPPPVPAAPAVPPPPAPVPAAATATPASSGIPVRFQIGYRPFAADENAPSWSLFVYLDGRFLAWEKPSTISLTTRAEGFDRALPAGHHVVRLVQERHERRHGGGWLHAARVAPQALAFDLAPGETWRVDLRLDEVKISRQGPLSLRVTSGDHEIAAASGGGDPESWAPLCDDVEANAEPGKPPSAEARRELKNCLRWTALWPGLASVPPRDQVRADLERDRFQPPSPAR
ncbi:MAG TPA: hypothetical protein VIH93_06025, partial [Thermoanaerobaculia bacterium]